MNCLADNQDILLENGFGTDDKQPESLAIHLTRLFITVFGVITSFLVFILISAVLALSVSMGYIHLNSENWSDRNSQYVMPYRLAEQNQRLIRGLR